MGLQMRATAENPRAARLVGVRPDRVIASGFVISAILAATTSVLLLSQTGTVTPDFGLTILVFGLVAAVVGGLGSPTGAVLGGFALGVLSVILQAGLPLSLRPFRDGLLFSAVFIFMTIRPEGFLRSNTWNVRL